jgi:hypothetical protein
MLQQPRLSASSITRSEIPTSPGVYAWFRGGEPVYVGRAKAKGGLRRRLAGNHLKVGPDLSKSAFRRNVCESLGVADTSITRVQPLTPDQTEIVNAWIADCEIAWIECPTPDEAADLETDLKNEWKPPLTKR